MIRDSCWKFAAGILLCLASAPLARASDLVTLSGNTYHQVRVVRVEPDGLTCEHAMGLCKVDFTDLSEAARKKYHYDPKQAAAYKNTQAQTLRQAAERTQQNQAEAAAWQTKRTQQLAASASPPGGDGAFVLRSGVINSPAGKSILETMENDKARLQLTTRDDGTLWDRRLWAVPCLLLGGSGYTVDISSSPVINPNDTEYRASIHHPPGAFAPDSFHDNFYQPVYLTNSYYKDVERAEAFARNRP